jgi:DNA-binding NarL/FixJ family response regulator
MKVLIADDHALLRRGLIQILSEAYPDAEFREASTASEAIACLAEARWDVLVLDIFMPGRSGFDVLREARRQCPTLPVLALSCAPEDQLAVPVLKAGARGYLNKQVAAEELVAAVKALVLGRRYVSASLAERLAADVCEPEGPRHERLSGREFEVLQGLLAGRSIKAIADALSLSPKTVSAFHVRIWQKLGVQSDAELVRYAIEHGLAGGTEAALLSAAAPGRVRGERQRKAG